VPNKFIPAVEKGVRECLVEGVIANCTVVDIRTTLYDGSYHDVDSSDMASSWRPTWRSAKAFLESNPVLLEPMLGDRRDGARRPPGRRHGDLSGRRGKILGVDSKGSSQAVKALVPLAELWKYSTHLRSLTQGRGMHQGGSPTTKKCRVMPWRRWGGRGRNRPGRTSR